jgi:putative addiction module CopG family antidote
MTIQLPEDLERFLQEKVLSGRFASEQDAITEALKILQESEEKITRQVDPTDDNLPPWQRIQQIMESVPDEVFDRIPTDGSEQHDHYLYGSPRRPNS